MTPAITVDHVSKHFRLSAGARSLKTAVLDLVRRRPPRLFTALNDVSFSVQRGETLGLIGANGAGKSTLLAIIAQTMSPSAGRVGTHGVVSSLLELGAGFHPDLTGRENVYLYGAIMGIPRETMRQRFDAIVEFAGLAEFIDQPVRFYSSGMYVRLGFAVAVQVNPDILLIDEVLAVGDADFQQRCLDKMAEFRALGKSMLIISHDMHTIRAVSDRIVFLDHGTVKGIGAPTELVAQYQAHALGERTRNQRREWGTGDALLTSVTLVGPDGAPRAAIGADRRVFVHIAYRADHRIETPTFGFSIADAESRLVFGSNTELDGANVDAIAGEGHIMVEIDTSLLQAGDYLLSFSLHSRDHKVNYHRLEHTLPFHLDKIREFDGLVTLPSRWHTG
jgi:ABC-type polysaccharide/polyol phosphate transport system ATPase subunit